MTQSTGVPPRAESLSPDTARPDTAPLDTAPLDTSLLDNGRPDSMRLDKALWYLRFAHSRSAAQAIIAAGHLRLDGRRVERASTPIRAQAILVLPGPPRIRVVRVVRLPHRRGPPAEAAACYVDMGIASETPVDSGDGNATAARPG